MRFASVFAAAIGSLSLFAGINSAASAQSVPSEIVKEPGVPILSFDVENLGPILTEMNYLWQARQAPDGKPFILVNAEGQTVFVLSPLACQDDENTGCTGLQFISVFEGAANAADIQRFNNRYAFASLGVNERGNAYLNRYDIADYGIARGNVAILISTFASLSKIYTETIGIDADANGVGGNVSFQQTGNDAVDAAMALITQQPEKSHHDSSTLVRISETGANLKKVFADEALPKNKILNIGQ